MKGSATCVDIDRCERTLFELTNQCTDTHVNYTIAANFDAETRLREDGWLLEVEAKAKECHQIIDAYFKHHQLGRYDPTSYQHGSVEYVTAPCDRESVKYLTRRVSNF